jgi:hypothetical protein
MRLEEKYNLPKGVFLALVQQESNFKPDAVSKAGAYGLAQLMPGTAEGLGVDPRDWKQNLDGGARYLAQQYKAFGGDLSLALAGYNAGPGAVRKAGNAIPNFPETQKYVAAVMRNAGYPMSPPKLADGGLIDLARKYADGGSVVGSAQVYDPAVIAAIAASIVEPQGYAEGGQAAPTSSEWDRYLPRDLPDSAYGDLQQNLKYLPLNYPFLLNKGAIRITQPGSGDENNPHAINSSDPEKWSLVSAYNDLYPNSPTRGWASKPESYESAIKILNNPGGLYDGKYRQILQSARDLGLRPDEVFMPEKKTRGRGYADGGTATGVSSDDATPPDYSGQYNTALSEKLETEFQSLIKQIGRQRDLADYDMRGAFAAGQLKPDGRGHLTSQFKKPNHPTFSQDSIWNGSDGYTGGHWRQDAKQSWSFTPSATNLNMHGIGGLRDYWDKQEAPAGNVLNMGRIPFAAGGYVQGYAEGGVTTGVSSDETAPVPEQVQAPRTFADLVGRYGVGDAMQVAAPLDDQSLGAGVLRKISNYVRPIGQGFLEILPTVKNYAAGVAADPNPFTRLGSDISTLGSAVWEGVKNDPLGTVLDILPVVGEVRSAMDADEFRNKAVEAERAGDEKQAAMFRQLSAVGMAGAVPLVGMAARAANRGVKLGVEGAEVAARAGARGVEQAVETAAREGAAKSVEAAKFAGKAGSTPKEMAALLDDVRGTQIGKMADRYNSLPGEEATQLLYQDLKGLAVEGNVGKEWYERSSDRILEFVGGNKDQADKFAQLIAIYSPQTSVDVNTQNAMKSYNRAIVGEQIWNGTIINPEITFKTIAAANRYMKELGGLKAGVTKVPLDDSGKRFLIAKHDQIGSYDNISTLDRDLKAHLVMNENIPFEGRKINNFYNNLMVQIDPSRLQGSTQDLWMARAFGFLDDAVGSGAKYDFMERMTADLAKEMNWKPHQIQAAIWVAMKTRQESVKDSVRAAALEQGIAKNVSDPKSPNNMVFQVIDGNEAQYANILREASLGANITEEAIALAARNFSDFLDQNLAYVSWETVPSTKIGHLDGLGNLPPQARAEYHTEMSKALQDSQGRDLLARYLNILTPGSVTSPGYWENASNPATLTQVGATRVKGAGQQPTIDSASRSAMELYSNALGLLLKQDGVGFHRPYYNPQVTKANGMEYQFEKALSRDDIINIGKLLDEKFDGSVALIPVGDKQVRILSFGDAKDQRGFHKAVDQVLQSASMDNAAGFRVFGSDGDLVFNNWKEKPNGEDYVSRISSAGRPDVLEYLSDFLAPKVQAVDRKFASQYNLKTNEKLENYLSGLGKNFERKAQGGVVRFAEGGSVQGYADGGSASGSASNSLADLYEKYYGDPTTRISYAQGGSVDSAPVYDPAVIAAIAASITEDNYA